MNRSQLAGSWIKWRRFRYGELMAEGLPAHVAWPIAKGEAKIRQRVTAVLGKQAALDAKLTLIERGQDSVALALVGDIAGVEPAKLDKLKAELALIL